MEGKNTIGWFFVLLMFVLHLFLGFTFVKYLMSGVIGFCIFSSERIRGGYYLFKEGSWKYLIPFLFFGYLGLLFAAARNYSPKRKEY